MGTRIQTKSRGTKKPMALVDVDIPSQTFIINKIFARVPRPDPRGYPESLGIPIPVLVQGLVIVDLGDDPDAPAPDPDPVDIDIYPDVYTVVQGDTLWAISQGWGVTVQEAADWNSIADPNLILIGQVLYKPGVPIP